MRPWTFASLVFLTLAAVPLAAADNPRLGESIDVSIVNVDAIVTDSHGNRVRGLTKDDFEIYENGKLQPLTNFAEFGGAQAPAAAGDAHATQPRTIVVFIEHFRAPDFKRDPFFNGVREFLHRTVRPGDSVKIAYFTDALETKLEFTDRLDAIDHALDSIRADCGPGIDEVTYEDALLEQTFSSQINASRSAPSWVDGKGNSHASLASEMGLRTTTGPNTGTSAAANFRFMRMRQKIAAITALMNSIAGSDSKKVFVMSVRRFTPTGFRDVFEAGNLIPSYGWNSRFRSDAMLDYVAKTANANGITVYALHPEGLGREGFGTDALFDYELLDAQLPYLDDIAKQTGGALAWGTDIEKKLPKMAEDLDDYYSLGYRATSRNIDRARPIVVKAKNPEYKVRSRREYVEKSDQTRMRERVIANLFDENAASSMKITVEVGKSRYVNNGHYSLPVTVHIPTAALMTDGGRGRFSVFIGWVGVNGEIGDVTKQTQKFTITSNTPETLTYDFEVAADQNTSRLSIGVFDEVSKDYGLRRVDLTDLGRVASLR